MAVIKVTLSLFLCSVFVICLCDSMNINYQRNIKRSVEFVRGRRSSSSANPPDEDDDDDVKSYFDTFLKRPAKSKSDPSEDVDQTPQMCGKDLALFQFKFNTIIKTKESLKNGAKFIASPQVQSNKECIEHCCSESECNLAVYDGKGHTSCYLFDCSKPGSCLFTSHSNYTTTHIQRLPPEPALPPIDEELENLKKLSPEITIVNNEDEDVVPKVAPTTHGTTKTSSLPPTTTTTTVATTTTTTKRPTTPTPARKVNLLETCRHNAECLDENAVCDNVCICKPGMKPSYGKCALVETSSVCDHLQFTCRSQDSYTHCIASYDRCDGIAQCPLGDDEVGCQGGPEEGKKSHIQRRPGVDRMLPSTSVPSSEKSEKHEETDAQQDAKPKEAAKDVESTADKSSATKQDEDGKPDDVPASHETKSPESEEPKPEKSKSKAEIVTHPTTTTTSKTIPKVAKTKPEITRGETAGRIVISKIEIDRQNVDSTFQTYDGNLEGAIVALILGLVITGVLLVFVVCKLRNVKRRLRRGRLASNDADYLINGMYL